MSTPYSDKIVLVTGASTGMGKGTALYLAKKSVKALTLFARGKEKLEAVAKEIEASGSSTKVLVVAGDVSKDEDNRRAVEETVKAFGGITSAFLNAGTYRGGSPLTEVRDEDIDSIIDVNVKSVIYGLRHVAPAIAKTVGENKMEPTGSIIVNSSCMAEAIIAPKSVGSGLYSASKAFVNSLVKTAAIENAPRIRINGVMPGVIKTSIMQVDDETYNAFAKATQPLWGRPGIPEEVAALVSFLISDEASLISGSIMMVDGLWSLTGGSM